MFLTIGLQGPEPGDQPIDIQSNFMNQSPSSMDQQGFGQQPQGMSFKKVKKNLISIKQLHFCTPFFEYTTERTCPCVFGSLR